MLCMRTVERRPCQEKEIYAPAKLIRNKKSTSLLGLVPANVSHHVELRKNQELRRQTYMITRGLLERRAG